MAPIEDKLAALHAATERLNAKSDSLNEIIEQLEDRLRQSGSGVSVWLDSRAGYMELSGFRRANDDEASGSRATRLTATCWLLGYCKTGKGGDHRWRIAAKRVRVEIVDPAGYDRDDDDVVDLDEPIPLLKAPRGVRVEAAEHLENLVGALVAKANVLEAAVDKARTLIR